MKSEDSEHLNTSFVERLNLTIRQGSAYLRRCSPRATPEAKTSSAATLSFCAATTTSYGHTAR